MKAALAMLQATNGRACNQWLQTGLPNAAVRGQRSESTFRITVYEPPNRLALAGVVEPYRCLYELQPQSREDVTELSFTFELLELKVFMRPFEQLVRSAIQDGAVRTVENIKRLVENGKSATAGRL